MDSSYACGGAAWLRFRLEDEGQCSTILWDEWRKCKTSHGALTSGTGIDLVLNWILIKFIRGAQSFGVEFQKFMLER